MSEELSGAAQTRSRALQQMARLHEKQADARAINYAKYHKEGARAALAGEGAANTVWVKFGGGSRGAAPAHEPRFRKG